MSKIQSPTIAGKLGIFDFSRELITTGDLDPVYIVLHRAELDDELLKRWLLAYWCFYHAGTASWIADTYKGWYWDRMMVAAKSKYYPRNRERRHFRGINAINSVKYLREAGLEVLFTPFMCEEGERLSLQQVMSWAQEWVGFGPWIAFKVADMLERLGLANVAFNDGAMFLFDSPREGAELMYQHLWTGYDHELEPARQRVWAVESIVKEFKDVAAPPRYERPINCQEAETCLCKWKSYMGGHYRLGEDIEGLRLGLLNFPRVSLAQRLLKVHREAF